MKRALLVLVGLSSAIGASTAEARQLTTAQFLSTAKSDYALRNRRELTDYYKNAPRSTPYLDRVEFRTETGRFDILRQTYALRVYPKGWGETSYTRQLSSVTKQANELANQSAFNSALRRRYALVLDYLEIVSLLGLHTQLLAVLEDRITVLRKQRTTVVNFDVTTLITAENKFIDQRLELVRLRDRLTSVTHKIETASGSPDKPAFKADELLPIARIASLARTVQGKGGVDNIYLQRRRLRIERADAQYHLEVAKNRDYLRFLKVEFDTEDYDQPVRAFSIGLALKLPFINPDRDATTRRKVRLLDEKLRYEEELRETSERIVSLSRSLLRMVSQHKILTDRMQRNDAETSFKRYMAMDGINPLTLLKIKESILKGDVRLVRIENDIRKRHVELLDLLGRLAQRPLRNLISVRGEVLR